MSDFLNIKYKEYLDNAGINTSLRLCHFFAQIDHESSFKPKRESLYYSTGKRAKLIFKTPFRDKSDEFISRYIKNPKRMGNYVYANRMGNGNESTGDGYRYRGGGFIQTTGKNNYQKLKDLTGVDFIKYPELINEQKYAMISAIAYWSDNNLNDYADKDDLDSISDIINIGRVTDSYGDANGFRHRSDLLKEYKNIF